MAELQKFLGITCMLFMVIFTVNAQIPMNWTIDEVNPGEDVMLTPDESFFTEGTRSCRLQLNSGAVPYLISDIFYITPGAAYEFSLDIFDNDTSGQVKVYADFYDAYGFDVFGRSPVFSTDSSEWQTVRWEGSVPEQAVAGYVLIKFYCQPNLYSFTKQSHVWIDNVRFTENGGNNLIVNGGFENWVVGIAEGKDDEIHLSLFPNPARNLLNVWVPEDTESLSVMDLLGREVIKAKPSGLKLIQLDVSRLPEGVFIVKTIRIDGTSSAGKFCKF